MLDLAAIEASLRVVAHAFARLNLSLRDPRENPDEGWIDRMMAGYAAVDRLVADEVDLFSFGRSRDWLELNALVLCGTDTTVRAEAAGHLAATEHRFYERSEGGVRDIVEWHALHAHESPWRRAAGVYIRMLSTPELFVEGNHRTGTLIMSWLLAREGLPPVVLTLDDAKPLLDWSGVFKARSKTGLRLRLEMPWQKRRFAAFLQRSACRAFLREPRAR
ncbi:hypothetical protein PQJ75_28385 [Rhodoplanes sp. TEM]|uniref:Fido domain-containing protein n=1 Tax=Rhodoplanes tepidamans TaxID=200616 RepID=A0ABT5JGV4_RHOTP|nr:MULTISPECIES: hypothetical protein [Rhodoplanes]MDC7788953.1 hypothetical protein [Rhodoplanes tepidamans]MDC7987671.1 hypothetical protein [Rhodoplanes sp. TEM]MDQ0358647.1 hypothetical protein [Rhodoplanes tepidamans]